MFRKTTLFAFLSLFLTALCGSVHFASAQTVYLNQNTSQVIDQTNHYSCNYTNPSYITTANSYYRVFKISDYVSGNSFNVDSVKFGISYASSVNGSQTVNVNLYTLNTGTVPIAANMTLISSGQYTLDDQYGQLDGTFFTAALPCSVPITSTLVVEVESTDGGTDQHYFYIGSNSAGQTKPSYWSAAACNTAITDLSTISTITTPIHLLIGVYGRPSANPPLQMPGAFTSYRDTVCEGSMGVLYTVPAVAGVTYNWTYSGTGVNGYAVNGSGTGSLNSNSIGVNFPAGATSGVLGVFLTNGTTTSPTRFIPVTVLPAMTPPYVTYTNGTLGCGTFASYAWYRNNVAIPGATTATYTPTQGGDYKVKVSNGVCEAYSDVYPLLDNPGAITAAQNPICANTNVAFSVPGTTGLTYFDWTYSGTGVTLNSYGSNTITADFAPNATSGTLTVVGRDYYYNYSVASTQAITVNPNPVPTLSKGGNVLTAIGTFVSYQWYRNGLAITGATQSTYTVNQTGSYYVEVTNAQGCTSVSEPAVVDELLAIKDVALANKIKIYPNPAKDMVVIESPVIVNATLTRVDGRVVADLKNVKTIDLKSFSAGIYFITLTDEDGVCVKKEKLVKVD